MSKRKSILVVTLVLSGAVLMFSWLLQGSPQTAPAAELTVNAAAAPASVADGANEAAPASTLRIIRAPFPVVPTTALGDRSFRNIFLPPRQVALPEQGERSMQPADNATMTQTATHNGADLTFSDLHQLTAVMNSATSALALVDDQWMEIGDSLENCLLIRIESEQAVFNCPGGDAILSIESE